MKQKRNLEGFSLVIRVHNEVDNLRRLLKRINSQKRIKDFETIVICSSRDKRIESLCKKYGCKFYRIPAEKFTHAYTFNLGAKKSSKKIVFYVSSDAIPKDNLWAYRLIKNFSDPSVGMAFSRHLPLKNYNTIEEFKIKKTFGSQTCAVKFSNVSGAIRKKLLQKFPYNEKVPYKFAIGEDQHVVSSVKNLGYRVVYEPTSIVFHIHTYSLKKRIYSAYNDALNKEKVKKWSKEISCLEYSKKELLSYLIKHGTINEIIFHLFLGALIIRVAKFWGNIKRILL